MKEKEKQDLIDGLKVLAGVIGIIVLFGGVQILKDQNKEKFFRENALETECEVTGWYEGRTGYRSPKHGYFNNCIYYIDENVHYFRIFTSVKPLPVGDRFTIQYYQYTKGCKKGKVVTVGSTEDLKLKFDGYGINDYGY